jgi:EmrB/QacA subfamily drug resistance transporter
MTATATPVNVVETKRDTSHGAILATVSVAAFMASLDLFIVNVAFPNIARDFRGASLGDLSWILSGYAVLYAALLVPLGRLADRYGRLAGFMFGLGLFTAASAACAASQNLWSLVAFRALQAVGAAALTPTSLGLLLAATPAERRVRAVRSWAAIGTLAAAFGPVVGGLLVQASWRWVFIVNVPVGIAGLVAARRFVPDSRDLNVTRVPDLFGALLVAVGIGALALGLVKGPDWGWSSSGVAGAFVVAVVTLAGFWRRSSRHPRPVVELTLLRVKSFAWSNLTAVLFSAAFGAGLLAAVLWLENVWGWSALHTGLAIAPGPLMVPVFTFVAQRLSRRVPPSWLTTIGCVFFAIGTTMVSASVGAHPSYDEFLPGWLIGGVGVGFAFPTIISAATADLPPERSSTGSAVVTMSRQIGIVLGVSGLVAVLGAPHGYAAVHAAFRHSWWVASAVSAAAAVTALGMSPSRSRRPLAEPAPMPSA